VVADPTTKVKELDQIVRSRKLAEGRTARGFTREDVQLFQAVMDEGHHVRGFTNRDIRERLAATSHLKHLDDAKKQSAKVARRTHKRRIYRRGFILGSRATGQNSTDGAKGATRSFTHVAMGDTTCPTKRTAPVSRSRMKNRKGRSIATRGTVETVPIPTAVAAAASVPDSLTLT